MIEKIKSEIVRIDLNDRSYKDSRTCIEPTYVNFFFGNNGTGKSTIAKAIQSGEGISFAPGRSASEYLPLVYNQEFIDEHMRSYRNMKGVFTLNAKNAEIQTKIEEQTELQTIAKKGLTESTDKRDKKLIAKEKIRKDFNKECWNRSKDIRTTFAQTQHGKGKSEPFAKAIIEATPKDVDIDELGRLYDSAYLEGKLYELFPRVLDVSMLDSLSNSDVLSIAIVNSADTELATFLRNIGATEWMMKGHTDYSAQANGKCPYCGQTLPENFEQLFIKTFDIKYQDNIERLKKFLEEYRNTANSIFAPLQKIPIELYPKIDVKPYQDKLAVIKAKIQSNIEAIKNKIDVPATMVTITALAPLFSELNVIVDNFNMLIQTNNDVVNAGSKKRIECVEAVFSMLAYQYRDLIEAYNKSDLEIQNELDNLNGDIKRYEKELKDIKDRLKNLRGSTVETETAKDSINAMLCDSGMQGFSLYPKSGVDNVYEVRRADGNIAENLSEGEKNFIAFLYFYHLVYGSDSAEGETRDKIVVIDDPVSSMDSGSLFIVSTLVRQMIEVCRNNADNRNKTAKGNFIKQIFILTHNAYFHREVSYSYVSRYDYASFYLIRKVNTKSYIKLCEDVNPNEPTERMNINPVKNSYAALWDEYKEVKSAVPLMNVIRRILEYYFLQLCGYDGAQLRDIILVKAKVAGRYKDERGNDCDEKFQLAMAMLAYINASSIGMSDGMDLVEECLNAEECKKIFAMIFDQMGQIQHYNMMMGNQ